MLQTAVVAVHKEYILLHKQFDKHLTAQTTHKVAITLSDIIVPRNKTSTLT